MSSYKHFVKGQPLSPFVQARTHELGTFREKLLAKFTSTPNSESRSPLTLADSRQLLHLSKKLESVLQTMDQASGPDSPAPSAAAPPDLKGDEHFADDVEEEQSSGIPTTTVADLKPSVLDLDEAELGQAAATKLLARITQAAPQ